MKVGSKMREGGYRKAGKLGACTALVLSLQMDAGIWRLLVLLCGEPSLRGSGWNDGVDNLVLKHGRHMTARAQGMYGWLFLLFR